VALAIDDRANRRMTLLLDASSGRTTTTGDSLCCGRFLNDCMPFESIPRRTGKEAARGPRPVTVVVSSR
jgi:hypothetical protein